MAQINKQKLKALIKECILEVLAEGLGNVNAITEGRGYSPGTNAVDISNVVASRPHPQRPQVLPQGVREQLAPDTVRMVAGKNGALASILEDTAKTSYQSMDLSDGLSLMIQNATTKGSAGLVAAAQSAKTPEAAALEGFQPEDLFEGSERWMDLALSPRTPKLPG